MGQWPENYCRRILDYKKRWPHRRCIFFHNSQEASPSLLSQTVEFRPVTKDRWLLPWELCFSKIHPVPKPYWLISPRLGKPHEIACGHLNRLPSFNQFCNFKIEGKVPKICHVTQLEYGTGGKKANANCFLEDVLIGLSLSQNEKGWLQSSYKPLVWGEDEGDIPVVS